MMRVRDAIVHCMTGATTELPAEAREKRTDDNDRERGDEATDFMSDDIVYGKRLGECCLRQIAPCASGSTNKGSI